jgi:hypothetical protein
MTKVHFRDHFRDYVQTKLKSPFDNLNDKQRSVWMARFYADNIIRTLNPGLIPDSDEDINECLIDGKGDCGVDFLGRQENTVLIIQAKYSGVKKSGKKANEKAETSDYFGGVLSRLYAGPAKYEMNQKLKEAISDIDWSKDNFILHYITLNRVPDNATANRGIDTLSPLADLPERASLEIFDEENLNLALRDAQRQESADSQTIQLRFSTSEDEEPWLFFEDPVTERKSYIGRVSGAHIAQLFKEHKSGLFTLNIRNYIGDTSTNRAIRKTAVASPNDFFYANNGICAVATRVRPDEKDEDKKTLLCDRFSIINGAQTVRSLAKAHYENAHAVRNVQVLIRLVEYQSKITDAEQSFLDNIIRNNNTQNAIKISDFRSNDRVQVSLRQHFAKIPAFKGKSYIYRNKRTGERDSLHIIVGMEEFVKTIHSFRFGPDDVFGGTAYLFNTESGGGYFKLFGDGTEIKASLTTTEFSVFAGTWFICEKIREYWKDRAVEWVIPALERRWLIFWTVGESLRLIYKNESRDFDSDTAKLADPYWLSKIDSKGEHYRNTVERHYKLGAQVLKKNYAQAEKVNGFSHRNWFRDPSTLVSIRSELESLLLFTSEQPERYVLAKS